MAGAVLVVSGTAGEVLVAAGSAAGAPGLRASRGCGGARGYDCDLRRGRLGPRPAAVTVFIFRNRVLLCGVLFYFGMQTDRLGTSPVTGFGRVRRSAACLVGCARRWLACGCLAVPVPARAGSAARPAPLGQRRTAPIARSLKR